MLYLGLCAILASSAPKKNNKIVVMDVEAQGVDTALASTVTSIVLVSLKELGVFGVLSRSDIHQLISLEEDKQEIGCTTSRCVAEMGQALGAAQMITGTLGKVGASYVLTLSLIDSKNARVLERESRKATPDKLLDEARAASRFVVRSMLEAQQGVLDIRVSERDAEIELDGRLVALSPAPQLRMAGGPHTVRVAKKGFLTFARDVIVDARSPAVIDVTLVPSLELIDAYESKAKAMRTSAYTLGGVGVAAVATGLALWFGYNTPRLNAHNAYKAQLDQNGTATPNDVTAINQQADSIRATFIAAETVAWVGAAALVSGAVLFLAGPTPGLYERYRTINVTLALPAYSDFVDFTDGVAHAAKLTFDAHGPGDADNEVCVHRSTLDLALNVSVADPECVVAAIKQKPFLRAQTRGALWYSASTATNAVLLRVTTDAIPPAFSTD